MFDNSDLLSYTEIRTYVCILELWKGNKEKMTENTVELIKLILENVDLEQAVLTASAIISDFLTQDESNQEETVVYQQVAYQTISSLK